MSESEFQALMDKKLAECRILSNMSVEQIALLCQLFSTSVCEVHARVEMVNGRPVAYLVRSVRAEADVPAFLKRQAS